ncbi:MULTISPECIES: hypothetical protein [Shewanella]|uniref:hypothetical protein n=1 Tax=Shewanella TaxID=22 RepID=UPI00119FB493|nr:hypothetical protein [Shewanella algae]MDC8854964.1 hypothetical protein [Shewanella algae]TWO84767.1 hypothetical protein AYI75_09610 [Shewanella algae]
MKLITLTTALVAVGMLAGCTTKSIDSITMDHYFLNARDLFVIHEKNGNESCIVSHDTGNSDQFKKDLGEIRETIYKYQCDSIVIHGRYLNPEVKFQWDNRGKRPVCSVTLKAKNEGKHGLWPDEPAAISRSYESMAELNLPNCDSIDIRWQEAK